MTERSKRSVIVAVTLLAAASIFTAAIVLSGRQVEQDGPVIVVPAASERPANVHLIIPLGDNERVLAHYTEHLAWLPNFGKDSRPEDRDSNAWTDDYAVGYWLSGPPEDLHDMLRRLKVVFDPIDLPRDMAETERDIVLREYDWRMADNPDAQAAEEMEAFLYEGNAIAASVIGTPDQINALTYDEAKAFHAATHRPELARLVVVGDISAAKLRRTLAAVGFPDLNADREDIAPPPFTLAAPETRTFRYPDPTKAPRMTWRKVVALPEPVDFDLLDVQTSLLRDILDTNLPGGLSGPLRFDAFIAKGFSVTLAPIDERHIELIFEAEPDKGISFAALQKAFESALADSAKGIPAETYDRVRDRFADFWPDWSDDEETGRWMADYTLDRVSTLREPLTQRQLRRLDGRIEAAGIDTLLSAIAGPGRTAVAFIGKDQAP